MPKPTCVFETEEARARRLMREWYALPEDHSMYVTGAWKASAEGYFNLLKEALLTSPLYMHISVFERQSDGRFAYIGIENEVLYTHAVQQLAELLEASHNKQKEKL